MPPMSKKRKTSPLWDHFEEVEENKKAKCYYCRKLLAISTTSIGSLGRHMRSRHPSMQINRDRSDGQPSSTPEDSEQVDSASVEAAASRSSKSSKIYLPKHKIQELDEQLVRMIAKGCHPIRMVDEIEFRKFVELLNPGYSLPTRKMLAESLHPKVFIKAMSNQDDQEASDNDDEVPDQTIKGEAEDPTCTCDARVSDNSTTRHELGCPAASKQHYWDYFEVSADEATCQICNESFNWTTITSLKGHLDEKHPTAEFIEQGEEDLSQDKVEEVYLEDEYLEDPLPQTTGRKRRSSSEQPKNRSGKSDSPRKSNRPQDLKESRDMQSERRKKLIESWYKGLDIFGQYVAEIMKQIPKAKCLKFQVQIVQRLLQEQATAG